MFAQERLDSIYQKVCQDGKVFVKKLSEDFKISEDAIRKDLKILEKQGVIQRTYGGAILKKQLVSFSTVNDRKDPSVRPTKKIIAQKAFDALRKNETIILDISTTNMVLAEMIRDSGLELTVISNSIDILYILSKSKAVTLISPGGMFFSDAGGFVGSETIESIKKYNVQKVFIGSCGIDLETGSLTTFNVEDGNTKRAFINAAREVFLVMENKKFFYEGIYKFADLSQIDTVVTEETPSKTIQNRLKKSKIKIL
ncbi:MAG TPA: DeoR/GlpR transcriptional regulator [Eubacteriaceae bacterium]|jgi:DeoR family glycerol-3-phosphate regulon repressor|nr:DeoR/GlpR transcriptional regulator [Eubacteriaceae bacterium]